jgi:hypothetical protein
MSFESAIGTGSFLQSNFGRGFCAGNRVKAGDFLTNARTLRDVPAADAFCGYAAAEISL